MTRLPDARLREIVDREERASRDGEWRNCAESDSAAMARELLALRAQVERYELVEVAARNFVAAHWDDGYRLALVDVLHALATAGGADT